MINSGSTKRYIIIIVILILLLVPLFVFLFSRKSSAEAAFQRGRDRYDQRLFKQAISEFTEAINLSILPHDRYLYWRGRAYDEAEQNDLATADFSAAIALNPD